MRSCPTFQRMNVAERREAIKDKGFCFNCLCTAHTRNFCPSRNKCMVCERNHHTMIHVDEPSHTKLTFSNIGRTQSNNRRQFPNSNSPYRSRSDGSTSPSGSSRPTTPSPDRRPHTSNRRASKATNTTTASQKPTSQVRDRLSQRSRNHVFLPTALARVLTANGPEKTRLLLSSGEAQTLVLKRLVHRLKISTTKTGNKEYCTLNLQSYHDPSAKVQIVGLVKPKFPVYLPKAVRETKLQSVYDHLTDLADPHFFKPTNVEILLANDHLPKIWRAGFIQTKSSMPIAQSTIFGWAISGGCQY